MLAYTIGLVLVLIVAHFTYVAPVVLIPLMSRTGAILRGSVHLQGAVSSHHNARAL
jgi:hypothetical protein